MLQSFNLQNFAKNDANSSLFKDPTPLDGRYHIDMMGNQYNEGGLPGRLTGSTPPPTQFLPS
jgi:hypothetical protein